MLFNFGIKFAKLNENLFLTLDKHVHFLVILNGTSKKSLPSNIFKFVVALSFFEEQGDIVLFALDCSAVTIASIFKRAEFEETVGKLAPAVDIALVV